MGLGLGISGVKKSTCGVALNKEQFDPTSFSPKNVCVHVSVYLSVFKIIVILCCKPLLQFCCNCLENLCKHC